MQIYVKYIGFLFVRKDFFVVMLDRNYLIFRLYH